MEERLHQVSLMDVVLPGLGITLLSALVSAAPTGNGWSTAMMRHSRRMHCFQPVYVGLS